MSLLESYYDRFWGGIDHLFITGAPVTVDDVTSGFNLGPNISG